MLTIKDGKFNLNGEKFNIYSGAIHYFRVLPEYWEDRLTKLKLAGFNTVETYVCWNLHEPKKGTFDFSGMLDIVKFLEIAKKVGLYAIVRPGPYICAEWDFGGFPAWLLKDKNLQLRCMNEDYLNHVRDFYKVFLGQINKMQITKGGNIIAMQVENEYGSYGNDKEYLKFVEKTMQDCGIDVLLFTSDGNWCNMLSGGSLPSVYKVLNFGSNAKNAFKALEGFQENAPNMCGEFWDGWFDHWGEKHHTRPTFQIVNELKNFLDIDASFNFYMFFGGTNFNFWAGANCDKKYTPTITSYDYSAPLTEWGGYTKTYHAIREVLLSHQGIDAKELPQEASRQDIGYVDLTSTASLMENIKNIGELHHNATPESMEYFGQNFGMILYHTEIKGNYAMSFLEIEDIHDRAYLYINGEYKTTFDRNDTSGLLIKKAKKHRILLPSFKGSVKIDILVDAMGRTNYGKNICDRKGISRVSIGNQIIFNWDVYTLPLDNLSFINYDGAKEKPLFLKGNFHAKPMEDCFIHMDGFTKGCVYVNGFNLGRFWSIGPQKALYCPGSLLKDNNEIVILEQEGYKSAKVLIDSKPDLG